MISVGCGYVVNSFYPSGVILWTTYGIAYAFEVAGYCSFKANIVRKHKYPENRSALTYWEEEAPSRLDLGKNKYGGPFTEEEFRCNR
uniref:Uncharacterized protein n=1 Tax=Amphimedon queenslandica TaxID=400682 RepID=A0A1X7SJY2_AMPQE